MLYVCLLLILVTPFTYSFCDVPQAQNSGGGITMHASSVRLKVSTKEGCYVYDYLSGTADSLETPHFNLFSIQEEGNSVQRNTNSLRLLMYPFLVLSLPSISQPLMKMMTLNGKKIEKIGAIYSFFAL